MASVSGSHPARPPHPPALVSARRLLRQLHGVPLRQGQVKHRVLQLQLHAASGHPLWAKQQSLGGVQVWAQGCIPGVPANRAVSTR